MSVFFIILGAVLTYMGIMLWLQRRSVTTLSAEQFREGYRKAQLIDIRENVDFKAGHILGARNIPFTQLNAQMSSLRKDMPIYLYDNNGIVTGRAAYMLYRKGYRNIFQLKGGFKLWDGKIKK